MASEKKLEFPNRKQRLAVMGHTGSGKTQLATHILSHAEFDKMPYVMVDYKGDELIAKIPWVEEIGLKDFPKHPGLYVVRPHPAQEDEMEKWLWGIWEREHTGLYFDEAYMIPNAGPSARGGAYISLLTQGRSKEIPVITLTQRPRAMTMFHFTEADHYCVFHLQDKRDRARVMEFVPSDLEKQLPQYHSWWHRGKDQTTFGLTPGPTEDIILSRFDDRLAPKRRFL